MDKLKGFELVYRALSPGGRSYLREESTKYKDAVKALQDAILPAVAQTCATCTLYCCRLEQPERSIYIAGTVGGFTLVDYLLARCDTSFPEIDLGSIDQNRCPYWDNGCGLPPESRSYLCLQYFCQELREGLEMPLVEERLKRVKSILEGFSLKRLFG